MEQLEDSTLDLIYRRRVRSYFPGYVIIFMIMGVAVALPLVKVDVVTSIRGMVRPLEEPSEVCSPMTGILDSTILGNNMEVLDGDTLLWIRRDIPDTKIKAHQDIIKTNHGSIHDILHILEGKSPRETSRFQQSYRNHHSALALLHLQQEFLHGEYRTAEALYQEEVIPKHEYEQTQSNFHIICAKVSDLRENYKNILEEEMYRLELENSQIEGEIELIKSTLQDFFVIAPASGTVHNCPGITSGSVIHIGSSLGIISPSGSLVAECYLEPDKIPVVNMGTRVKLRFDDPGFLSHSFIETVVNHIEKDISVVNGIPAYRIRCTLDNPQIRYRDGTIDPVRKGMTFTASFILFRRSLAGLILEKVNRWANPAESVRKE